VFASKRLTENKDINYWFWKLTLKQKN